MLSSKQQSERGAILINVAVGSIVLIAFTMFVVDYGILWLSRNQAQNSADAGALAGATSLAWDDPGNYAADGPARLAAHNFALSNDVWGENPHSDINTDIRFSLDAFDPAFFPDECDGENCVRVDVFRNQASGNPLPMWFGQLVGLTTQGVRAMAIAKAGEGNTSDCLKPWAIPDKWDDVYDVTGVIDVNTWTDDDLFEPERGDLYPGSSGGFTSADIGTRLVLKEGNPNNAIVPSFFYRVELPSQCPGGGSNLYECNIANCNGEPISIGDDGSMQVDTQPGNGVGPTIHGVDGPTNTREDGEGLIQQDPDAYWWAGGGTNGCVSRTTLSTPACIMDSPRIVCVPVFDPSQYLSSGRTTLRVAQILGFFVESVGSPPDADVFGYITTCPGIYSSGVTGTSPFIPYVQLVR